MKNLTKWFNVNVSKNWKIILVYFVWNKKEYDDIKKIFMIRILWFFSSYGRCSAIFFSQESAPLLSKRAFNSASHENLMSEITFDAASLKLSHLVVELNNSWPWHRGCRKSRVALNGTLIFHVIGLCDAVRLNGRSTWMTRLRGAGGNLINVKSSLSSPKRNFSRAKNCVNVILSR